MGEFTKQGKTLGHLLGGILGESGLDELAFAPVIQVQVVDDASMRRARRSRRSGVEPPPRNRR